jgi:hypothetical protein
MDDGMKYSFNSSITRLPYSGVEDFFSLSNYLQSIGKDYYSSLVNDFNVGEVEARCKLSRLYSLVEQVSADALGFSNRRSEQN